MEEQRVQTCDFYRTDPDLPHRFNNPDCFHGYEQVKSHPLYRTSNQTYGSKKPTVHEIQHVFILFSFSQPNRWQQMAPPLPEPGSAGGFFLLKGSFSFPLSPKCLLIGGHMIVGFSLYVLL